VQASVGSHCVECVRASRPPAPERLRRWSASKTVPATKGLIATNVAVFLYLMFQDAASAGGGRVTQGTFDLGLNRVFIADGEWWRLVTAGFIHFGIIHLAFNMYALWNLGPLLERSVGAGRFLMLYMASLLAGSAGALIIGSDGITGGASGAVFGLFGAAAIGMHQRGVNPLRTSIGTVLIINLVLTFAIPGISIGGHLGGLVGGALCGLVLFAPPWRQVPKWAGYAAPAAVMVLSVAVSIVVSQA
jgi:membrane associated rhomboid family serine protease